MAYPRSTSAAANYLGIGKQSVAGTGVTPTVFIPYQGSVDLDDGQDGSEIREAGVGTYLARLMKTKHDPNGGFGMAVRPKTTAQLIAWMLGADQSAASGSLWNHTATPAETLTPVTVEQAAGVDGDIIERFVDCYLKSLVLSCDGNQDVMAKMMWFGLTPNWRATTATPTYESGVSGISPGGPYRGAEALFTVDGSGNTNVRSWEVGLEWKMDEDIRLSQVLRGATVKLELTGSVKIKQLLNGTVERDDYRKILYGSAAGTVAVRNFYEQGSLAIALDNGLTTTNERELNITIPQIGWKKATYTKLNPDGETMYLEKEGVIEKGASAFVTLVSKTADTSAY